MARPLTKIDHDGHLYIRPPSVEASIDAAIGQDLQTLDNRAAITDPRSADFLPLECLVHLIRDAGRRGDENAMNTLLPRLLGRCEAILRKKMPTSAKGDWEDVREEILGDFSVLFAEDGSDEKQTLDFFECRFNLAFRNFRIPYIEDENVRIRKHVSIPTRTEEISEAADEKFLSDLAERLRERHPIVDLDLRETILDALDMLPPDQCKAIVLFYYHGLPIESEDPAVTSVASACGVTGRAIRYRMKKALTTLSKKLTILT